MKIILTTFFIVLLFCNSQAQKMFRIPRDYYKVNKTEFKKGDTIAVTIYNKFKKNKQYMDKDDQCFFSVNKKYSPSCPYNYNNATTPFANINIGDSAVFSCIITKAGTYRFVFLMSNVVAPPITKYNSITLKWHIKE